MRVQDHEVTFNIFKAMKHLQDSKDCFQISVVDSVVDRVSMDSYPFDPLEASLISHGKDSSIVIDYANLLDALLNIPKFLVPILFLT